MGYALALGALLVHAAPASARRYTLAQLIERVTADYAGVRAAREGIAAADAQLSLATRQWWPSGQLTFWITGAPNIKCTDGIHPPGPDKATRQANCLSTNVVDFRSDIGAILPVNGVALNLSANLVQPLYTFGKIEAAREAAKAGVEAARGDYDRARNEVTFNITRSYWGLKWSRAAMAMLDDGLVRLKEWVKKMNDDIDKGKTTYTENDVVRIKLAVDTAELVRLDIEKAQGIAMVALRRLTDDAEADIDGDEIDLSDVVEKPSEFYEDAALVHRPEVRMISAGINASKAFHKLRTAELMPDLGLAFNFTYAYASSVDDPQNAFMSHANSLGAGLALVLRYNLDIPQRLANWDKARADQRQNEWRRQQALGGIAIEIENAWQEAHSARKRTELLNHSEKVARGWYNAVDQNLQVGVAESRDLVDAARSFFELRLRHLQAIMDTNVAEAALRQVSGVAVR